MMKISAAVVPSTRAPFEIREIEVDAPRHNEVQVKLVGTGVCHTDAIVRDGWMPYTMPAVLGHEGSGIVISVGEDVTSVQAGDHVVLAPAYCGHCEQCLTGHPSYCRNSSKYNSKGSRVDGSTAFTDDSAPVSSHFFGQSSFASVTNTYENNVVKVPEHLPLELLGPLGCGIQTGAGAILNVLKPPAGATLAIFGTGAVGCAAMLAALAVGVTTIIMIDIVDSRLEFAKQLGATHTINSRDTDPVEAVKSITAGRGVEYALDTTGNKSVFGQLLGVVAPHGHAGLVGAAAFGSEVGIDIGLFLITGVTLSAILEGDSVPQVFIPRLIALYEAGRFPFDKLIKTYEFASINEAFADSASGDTLKPVLVY
jgi:aryl-alcohol dehydrogenase